MSAKIDPHLISIYIFINVELPTKVHLLIPIEENTF